MRIKAALNFIDKITLTTKHGEICERQAHSEFLTQRHAYPLPSPHLLLQHCMGLATLAIGLGHKVASLTSQKGGHPSLGPQPGQSKGSTHICGLSECEGLDILCVSPQRFCARSSIPLLQDCEVIHPNER
jgi:hypothetical protein